MASGNESPCSWLAAHDSDQWAVSLSGVAPAAVELVQWVTIHLSLACLLPLRVPLASQHPLPVPKPLRGVHCLEYHHTA